MSTPPHLALAVIGHVNHGKTALVRALTGMETDRLKEEIERGLSITLGFAWRNYDDGGIDFIDAPGHEDFLRAMVSGAAGARAALLVVSATEGMARQTWEHLRIAGHLGIRAGVVAVTKADMISPAAAAETRSRLEAELSGTVLAGAPMVFCSALTGEGLAALHAELSTLINRAPPAEALSGAFLPIDRAFAVAGAGAVVTGTLQGSALTVGSEVALWPSGRAVRVRQLQIHGQTVEVALPGRRVAVALRGVSARDIKSGDTLTEAGAFAAGDLIDVQATLAAETSRPLRHMEELAVHWGARRDIATARLFGVKILAPGESGWVRLKFPAPVIAHPGQRALLRRLSPGETLGGALVIDPLAPAARGAAPDRIALLAAALAGDARAVAESLARRDGGAITLAEAARLFRRAPTEVARTLGGETEAIDGQRLALKRTLANARRTYLEILAQWHRATPIKAWAPVAQVRTALAASGARALIEWIERDLVVSNAILLEGARVCLSDHDPLATLSPEALGRLNAIEAALRDGGLSPPDPAVLAGDGAEDRPLLDLLIDSGRALALRNGALRQTLVFHQDALTLGFDILRQAFPSPATFTTGEARVALATSRKFIVPVLERFDLEGLTQRDGDLRQVIAARRETPSRR